MEENRLRQRMYFKETAQEIRFCDLIEGEQYTIWAVSSKGCSPTVKHKTSEEMGGQSTMTFTAVSACMDFIFQKDLSDPDCDGEQVVSIGCQTCQQEKTLMDKMLALGVAGGIDDETLIKQIFIGGGCFDVENVEGKGSADGKGTFAGGSSTIGIEDGVILSSGNIYDALGPNIGEGTGQNTGGGSADPDLSLLTGGGLFDVTGIEFDFQPTISTIDFEYAFASEEYCEYVNSQFNDVFGFFISGPGISGGFTFDGDNIAVVPGGGYVAINSVNHLVNTNFFVGNNGSCNQMTNMNDIEFDGWTTVLTATANVIPCETYHIRLMIADVGDGIFDSAVFLKANSFNTGGTGLGEALSYTTGTNLTYEHCNDGFIIFTRASNDVSQDLIIDYTISPLSTATAGVDYEPLPSPIIIPAGETSITIPINVFNDGIPEGLESIILSMTNSCSCSSLEIELQIEDPPDMEVELEDEEECSGIPVFLEPQVFGGVPGGFFTYEWDTGDQSPVLVVAPDQTTTYSVTVTDMCGATAETSATVEIGAFPIAIIDGTGFMCAGTPDTIDIEIEIQGDAPWEIIYMQDGIQQDPITATLSPYILTVTEPGIYELYSIHSDKGDCFGAVGGIAVILESEIATDITPTPVTCLGFGSIEVDPSGGISPYNYTWSNGAPNAPMAENLDEGMYYVTISDDIGCEYVDSAYIEKVNVFEMEGNVLSGANCYDPNGGALEIIVTNGDSVTYSWTNGIGNIPNPTGLSGGVYGVTVSDPQGCVDSLELTVEEDLEAPAASAEADDFISCVLSEVEISGAGSASGNGITYLWSGPGIVGSPDSMSIEADQAGLYTILVTNTENGCVSTDSIVIDEDTELPIAEATADDLDCIVTELNIDGTNSSTGAGFVYEWTGPGIISGGATLEPLIDDAGTYNLLVTNSINGCTAETQIEIINNGAIPTALVEDPATLTCAVENTILDGTGSSSGADFTYQWYDGNGAIPGATDETLDVSQPGTYEIIVTDQTNGCTENYDVVVDQDILAPDVTTNSAGVISCSETTTAVSATVAGNVSYQWTTATGVIVSGEDTFEATVGSPGEYFVLVTDIDNGCTTEESVTVEENADIPEVLIAPNDNLDCIVTTVGLDATASSQSGTMTYTWTTTNGNITAGQNTLTPTIDAPGDYVLTIFDTSNGCENTSSITVTEDVVSPEVALPSLPILDCNVISLDIDGMVSNFPLTDLEFDWTTPDGMIDAGANNSTASVSTPGTYTLLVTNPTNGCTGEAAITIGQDIEYPETAIAQPDILTCASNSVTINATSSSTGPEFEYVWTGPSVVSSANTLTPVVNISGNYILEITNTVNGCVSTQAVVVDEDIVLPLADAGPAVTLNCYDPQLPLSGTASTGAEYIYEWNGPSVINGATTLAPVVDQPGDYVLLVTNVTNECTSTAMVTVAQDIAPPTAEAGMGGELSCSVSEMSLDGTGSSMGQYSYSWTSGNGNILSGNTTLSPIINAPGTYTIEVTNTVNGCISTDEVVIDQDDDLPQVDAGTAGPITCLVGEITLDGSNSDSGPDFVYEWTTANGNIVSGTGSEFPVVDAPGIYVLTITNTTTNCSNISSVTVDDMTQPPAVEAGPSNVLTCTEETLTLDGFGSATGAGYSYLWSTANGNIVAGANSLTPDVDEPGLYELLVTNTATGCTSLDQVNITQDANAPLAAATTPGILTCDVEMLDLSGNGSSTGNGFTYDWTTTDGTIVSGSNTLSPTINQPGTYQLLVTNLANGCTEVAEVAVGQDIQDPVADAGSSDDLTCAVTSLSLDASGSSQGASFTYNWTTTNGNIVTGGTSQIPTIDQIGTYNLLVTDLENGCTSTDAVTVGQDIQNPFASISPPTLLTCVVAEIAIEASASQGADFVYGWTTTNGNIVSGETTLAPVVDAPGTYTLLVSNEQNGCTESVQVLVNEDVAKPNADAGNSFVMDCFDEINYLDGGGSSGNSALLFVWETTNGNLVSGINSAQPGFTEPGIYQLTVTSSVNGCTDSDQVTITRDAPQVAPEVMQPPCFGDRGVIVFSGTTGGISPYLYSIDGGTTFSSDPIYTGLAPANYQIAVQDARGCEEEGEIVIVQPPEFQIVVDPMLEVDLGDSIQLVTQVNVPLDEIASVIWSPNTGLSCDDCLNPIVTPLTTMNYFVEVTTGNGCSAEAPVLLRVNKESNVFVPNVFSPNGDGVNDIFMIFADNKSIEKVNSFIVFSRWGEQVFQYFNFEPNNPRYGWDGKHRGESLNPEVFAWFAEIKFIDGQVKIFKGDVTLAK